MRITHFVKHFYPCIGGVENYCFNLIKELQKKNYNNEIITLNKCSHSKKKLINLEKVNNINVHRCSFLNIFNFYRISPFILRYTKNTDLIITHCHDFFVDFLVLTKWIHKKKIIMITQGGIFHTKNMLWLKKIYFNIWSKFIFKYVNKVIAISESDYNLYRKLTKKIVLIEAPIEDNNNNNKNLKKEKNSFLCLGRVSENKRIDNLVYTFSKIKNINYKLYIVGPDNEKISAPLKRFVNKNKLNKNIYFLGSIIDNKKKQILSKSEYIVSSSEYEGFGLTLLEGMNSKAIPIVQPNNSFIKLIKHKQNGYLIDYNNHNKASEEIINIIKKDNKNISEKAYNFSKKYLWKNKINDFIKIINDVKKND